MKEQYTLQELLYTKKERKFRKINSLLLLFQYIKGKKKTINTEFTEIFMKSGYTLKELMYPKKERKGKRNQLPGQPEFGERYEVVR